MARALTALTIAPLVPSGLDGIIVDVRTFSALGLHACAAATAVQDAPLSPESIATQVEAVLSSVQVDAVKLTCPADAAILEAIAGVLLHHDIQKLVVDPGGAAFDATAVEVLKTRLLPLSLVTVPNLAEAQALAGRVIDTWEDMREAAHAIAAMGPANVVIKGKTTSDMVTDILFDSRDYRDYTAQRVDLTGVTGAGTTFAAAVAATLGKGETVHHSIAAAKAYVTKALQSTYDLGGPPALHHFYRYWQASAF